MTPIKIIKYLSDFLIFLNIEKVKKINYQNNLKYTEKKRINDSYNLGDRIVMR